MRRFAFIVGLLIIVLVGASLFVDDEEPTDTPASTSSSRKIMLTTRAARGADARVAKLVRTSGAIEEVIATVDAHVRLPRRITVVFGGDPEGPYYDSNEVRIEYPWQFVRETRRLLAASDYRGRDLDTAVIDATRFILAHELGHALIDQLKLPVLGREEEAADGFAAFAAVRWSQDGDQVIGATDLFDAFDTEAGEELADEVFFDNHSLDLQRFYTISCLVYGADTKRYAGVIDGLGIDKERRQSCPEEWELLSRSWRRVLAAHAA